MLPSFAVLALFDGVSAKSFGTIDQCFDDKRCLWIGDRGDKVVKSVMIEQFLKREGSGDEDDRRKLQMHANYLEGTVVHHGNAHGS